VAEARVADGVKERLLDGVDAVKELVRRYVEDFKSQTGFFKAKTAIILGYVAVAVLSFMFIPPPGEHNPLGARIKVGTISFGSREKAFVEVTNEGGTMWEKAVVTIQGTHVRNGNPQPGVWAASDRVRKNEKRVFYADDFRDKQGFKPEIDVKVTRVVLEAEGQVYAKDLAAKGAGR